jgi:hypothetical protein
MSDERGPAEACVMNSGQNGRRALSIGLGAARLTAATLLP